MSALLLEKSGAVATLTINRPESRNPLGEEGDGDLFAGAAAEINADRTLRCVILTGAGTAFSAGGNVKAMRERSGPLLGPVSQSASVTAPASTASSNPCGASKCR
jgi:enoyl-CoA hydratase/carnithine racemase